QLTRLRRHLAGSAEFEHVGVEAVAVHDTTVAHQFQEVIDGRGSGHGNSTERIVADAKEWSLPGYAIVPERSGICKWRVAVVPSICRSPATTARPRAGSFTYREDHDRRSRSSSSSVSRSHSTAALAAATSSVCAACCRRYMFSPCPGGNARSAAVCR